MSSFVRPAAFLLCPSVLVLVLSAPAHGQEDSGRRVENPLLSAPAEPPPAPTGQLTKAPELLGFVEATYPKEAEAARIEGSVGLLVDLDEKGDVTAVEVTEPAGHGFDEAAVEALRKFRFTPAEIDGQPAPVRIGYRYSFVLKPEVPEAPPVPPEKLVTLRGVVLQRGNRAPIPSADVSVDEDAFRAVTDEKGAFEIPGVPPGTHRVVITALGFDRFVTDEVVEEGKRTEATYYVRKRIFSPYETIVRGQRERKEVARVELKQEEIRLIPGTQGDAFKVVQNLPGVARAPYGFGMLVVRGGKVFDTRVYIDGVWIPAIFHFGGLTSTFNSDLLSDITFLPGNFGASFGRAMAGTVEGQTRSPARDAYHGYLNVSLLDTTVLAEGPVNENWSFAGAGRVSYADLILREFLPATVSFVSAPRYLDYQARLEWAPKGGRDRVRFTAFGSSDSMKVLLSNPALLDPEGRSDVGGSIVFHRLSGAWTRTFSPEMKNTLSLTFAADMAGGSAGGDIRAAVDIYSVQLRDAFVWELDKRLTLEAGTDTYFGKALSDLVSPPAPLPGEIPDPLFSRQLRHDSTSQWAFQPGLYAEAIFKPLEGTRLVPGVRFDYEHTLGYVTLDPRLSAFQKLGEKTLLKAAVGMYQQPPDFRSGQWTPEFGNPDLGAERSVQGMIGVEQQIVEGLSLDVQLYYKKMTNLVFRSDRTIVRDGQEVLERYNNSGTGRAYGAELLLRKELTHNFFGWIAYSISKSERLGTLWAEQKWRPQQFDQPHHLTIVASYKWPYDWVTGLRFQYVSGSLTTPMTGRVYDADGDLHMPIPGEAFSQRNPSFMSLDVRIDRRFVFELWSLAVFLDIQNVTNNENPEFVLYNYDYSQRQYLRGLPIFPTLGIKAEF